VWVRPYRRSFLPSGPVAVSSRSRPHCAARRGTPSCSYLAPVVSVRVRLGVGRRDQWGKRRRVVRGGRKRPARFGAPPSLGEAPPFPGCIPRIVRRAGTESSADDLGPGRGVVVGRAVPTPRSVETHPLTGGSSCRMDGLPEQREPSAPGLMVWSPRGSAAERLSAAAAARRASSVRAVGFSPLRGPGGRVFFFGSSPFGASVQSTCFLPCTLPLGASVIQGELGARGRGKSSGCLPVRAVGFFPRRGQGWRPSSFVLGAVWGIRAKHLCFLPSVYCGVRGIRDSPTRAASRSGAFGVSSQCGPARPVFLLVRAVWGIRVSDMKQ
jgi:hypothetical protein